MSVDTLQRATEHLVGGEPILVSGGGAAPGAFVASSAVGIRAAGLRRLGALGGDMVLLALDERVAARIGVEQSEPIDAACCRHGGWSLEDRALTMRLCAAADTLPADLSVPGHVPTLRVARAGGDLADIARAGGPAVALEVARSGALPEAVAVAAVLDRDGRPVALQDALRDARLRRLAVAPSEEVLSRAVADALAAQAVQCALPTREGGFRALAGPPGADGSSTLALIHGEVAGASDVLVHEHVHCLLGDAFGSLACECRANLDRAVEAIVERGRGVIVYTKHDDGEPLSCPRAGARRPGGDTALTAGLLARSGVASSVRI